MWLSGVGPVRFSKSDKNLDAGGLIFAKTLLSFMIALWISLSLMELLAMTMLQISCSCWWLNTAALPPAWGCCVEVDRYGFFSGRCRYLEIRAANGCYIMPIIWGRYVWPIFFFLFISLNLSQIISKMIYNILKKVKHLLNKTSLSNQCSCLIKIKNYVYIK